MDKMLIMWIASAVIFFVVEVLTSQIVTIWFAIGSIGAIFANVLGAKTVLQIVVFAALSLVTLLIARPYMKKFTQTQVQPTNADMCIGAKAVVTEDIDNTNGTGQVKVKGAVWSAKSADDSVICEGTVVTVKKISGVKLIVALEENT